MTELEMCLYLSSSFVSGYCLGFGIFVWRRLFETL